MNEMHERRGFALPAAIGALVIVGVLVTAGFYVARQEVRTGVASRFSAMAVNVAQSGANDVMITQAQALKAMAIGGNKTVVDTADAGIVTTQVTRLAQRLYFLNTSATITEGGALWSGATRRIGLLTRLSSANMNPPAALTTQGSLTVGGSSIVNGMDTIPAGWGGACDAGAMVNKPGLLIDDTTNITTGGAKFDVLGDPPTQQDTTINTAKLLDFGDELTWQDLTALAEKVYPVGTTTLTQVEPDSVLGSTSYRCNTPLATNWGSPYDPFGVCGNYFPIIYAKGDLKISGGEGQGILLIEGSLTVDGGFEFYGPVWVKGELTTQGTGGHFNGGVVAANVDLGTSTVLGDAVVNYSSCAVTRAVLNNSALTKVRPLAMRGWVDLSNIIGS